MHQIFELRQDAQSLFASWVAAVELLQQTPHYLHMQEPSFDWSSKRFTVTAHSKSRHNHTRDPGTLMYLNVRLQQQVQLSHVFLQLLHCAKLRSHRVLEAHSEQWRHTVKAHMWAHLKLLLPACNQAQVQQWHLCCYLLLCVLACKLPVLFYLLHGSFQLIGIKGRPERFFLPANVHFYCKAILSFPTTAPYWVHFAGRSIKGREINYCLQTEVLAWTPTCAPLSSISAALLPVWPPSHLSADSASHENLVALPDLCVHRQSCSK